MGWETNERDKNALQRRIDPDKVFLSRRRVPGWQKSQRPFMYRVFIGERLFKRLRWAPGVTVLVQWGTESDFGKVRIAPGASGGSVVRKHKYGVAEVPFGSLPIDCAFLDLERQAVSYSTADLGTVLALTVDLPAGFLIEDSQAAD